MIHQKNPIISEENFKIKVLEEFIAMKSNLHNDSFLLRDCAEAYDFLTYRRERRMEMYPKPGYDLEGNRLG